MHNKKNVLSATILTLILLLLVSLSLQYLVNFEMGQVGRNLVGRATDSGSGQIMITILAEEEAAPPTPPPTSSGGAGPSLEIPGFYIDYDELKVLMKVGKTTERIIKVSNTGDTSLEIIIKGNNLDGFINISETEFNLSSGESKDIIIYFNSIGKQAGLYNGEILFTDGSLEVALPVIIEIESIETVLDVRVNIPEEFKILVPGEDLSAKISMFNLGEVKPIDAIVDYFIKDMDGNIILKWSEEVSIIEGRSFSQTQTLPEDLNPGMYVFYMEARYEETVAISGSLFEIVKIKHLEKPATIPGELIAEQVFSIVKRVYAKPIIGLLIMVLILLVSLITYQYNVLRNLPQSQHKKIREIHIGLKKSAKNKSEKELYVKKLKKQLRLINVAYRLKHISDKAYKKSKEEIDKILKEL